MKSIKLLFVTVLATASLLVPTKPLETTNLPGTNYALGESLFVHYYRFDQNYTGWVVHFFGGDPEVSSDVSHGTHNFDASFKMHESEVVFKYDIPFDTNPMFIIHKNNFAEREPSVSDGVNGTFFPDLKWVEKSGNSYHTYVVQNSGIMGISREEFRNNKPDSRKIGDVRLKSNDVANLGLHIEVKRNDINATISEVKLDDIAVTPICNGIYCSIILSSHLDISNAHQVTFKVNGGNVEKRIVLLDEIYDTEYFRSAFNYTGNLGVSIINNDVSVSLWAPNTTAVDLNLYDNGSNGAPNVVSMIRGEKGVYNYTAPKNELVGKYYTFSVKHFEEVSEIVDPYAYSTGINGNRGLIVDFESINEELAFANVTRPRTISSWSDYSVYELHVRDLTTHSSWSGSNNNRGKFLGLAEENTSYQGYATGLDYIKELGVNAVQLLPIYDNGIIDEERVYNNDPTYNTPGNNPFNWGYMPKNYNSLEGSYSSNPNDGTLKIKEFKKVVDTFSRNNLRIIMDVVYNHTGQTYDSNFHKILPGYYHRMDPNHAFYNGSGCLNETASERPMMRKFMIDSLKFYATEYKLSGFRFDLMGLHDVETMNMIVDELNIIDETIIVYGEPWDGGDDGFVKQTRDDYSTLPANYANLDILKAGSFNDQTRDALKGSPDGTDAGWLQGNTGNDRNAKIRYGLSGGTFTETVVTSNGLYDRKTASDPKRMVNYLSAHDNLTLNDKFEKSGVTSEASRAKLAALGHSIIAYSQGVAFFHAGCEFLRSKGGERDSYDKVDSVNQIKWNEMVRIEESYGNVTKLKEALRIRKNSKVFRFSSGGDIYNSQAFSYDLPGESGVNVVYADGYIAFKLINGSKEYYVFMISNIGVGLSYTFKLNGKKFKLVTPENSTWSMNPGVLDSFSINSDNNGQTIILEEVGSIVSFDVGAVSKSIINDQFIAEGQAISKPNDPVVDGMVFDAWYVDGVRINDISTFMPNGDMTVVAGYKPYPTRYVYFYDNEGSIVAQQAVVTGALVNLNSSELEEYKVIGDKRLVGWYLDRDFTIPFDPTSSINTDISLFGKYEVAYVNVLLYTPEKIIDVNVKINATIADIIATVDVSLPGYNYIAAYKDDIYEDEFNLTDGNLIDGMAIYLKYESTAIKPHPLSYFLSLAIFVGVVIGGTVLLKKFKKV